MSRRKAGAGAGAGSRTQIVEDLKDEDDDTMMNLQNVPFNDPEALATGIITVGNVQIRIPDFHNPNVPIIRNRGSKPSQEDEMNLEAAAAMVNDNPQAQFDGTALRRGVGFVHTVMGMQQEVRAQLENVTNHPDYVKASKVYAAHLMLGNLGARGVRQLMSDGGTAWERAFKATYNVMFAGGGDPTHEQVKKAQRAYAHLVGTTRAENVTPEDMEATGLVAGEALAQHFAEGAAVGTSQEMQERLQTPITQQGSGALEVISRQFVDHANEQGAARGAEAAAKGYSGENEPENQFVQRAGAGAGGMGSDAKGYVPDREGREARAMDAEYYKPENPDAERDDRVALRGELREGDEKVAAAQEEARQWQFLASVNAAPEVVAAQKAVLEAEERRKQERLNEERRAQNERQQREQMDADRRRRRAETRDLAAQYQDFVEREAEHEAARQNARSQAQTVLAEGFGDPGAHLPGAGARDVPERQTKTKKRPRPRPQIAAADADAIPDAAFDEVERSIRERERRMQRGEEKPREPERAPSPPPVGAAMAVEPPRQRDPLDFRKADYDKDDGLGPRNPSSKRKGTDDQMKEAAKGRQVGGDRRRRVGAAERDQYDRDRRGKRPGEGGSDRPTGVQRREAEEREPAATRPIEGGEDEERPAQRADRRHARGSEFHRPEAGKRGREREAVAEPKRSRRGQEDPQQAPQQAEQPQAPQPQEERRGRGTKHRKERTQRRHDPYGGRTRVRERSPSPGPPPPPPPEEKQPPPPPPEEKQPPAGGPRQQRQDWGESKEESRARRHAKRDKYRSKSRDPGGVRGADEPKEDPTEKKGEPEQKGEAKVPDPLAEAKAPGAPGGSRFRPGDHTKPAPRPRRKPGSQTMVEEPGKKPPIVPVDDDTDDDDDPFGYGAADGSHVKPGRPPRQQFHVQSGKQFLYVVVVYKVPNAGALQKDQEEGQALRDRAGSAAEGYSDSFG